MEREELRKRLMVYSLAINFAGLCFAGAALLIFGPLHAIAVFLATVTVLLAAVYRKRSA